MADIFGFCQLLRVVHIGSVSRKKNKNIFRLIKSKLDQNSDLRSFFMLQFPLSLREALWGLHFLELYFQESAKKWQSRFWKE